MHIYINIIIFNTTIWYFVQVADLAAEVEVPPEGVGGDSGAEVVADLLEAVAGVGLGVGVAGLEGAGDDEIGTLLFRRLISTFSHRKHSDIKH